MVVAAVAEIGAAEVATTVAAAAIPVEEGTAITGKRNW